MTNTPTYAFDFETTSLDPTQGRIISYAIFGPGCEDGYVNRDDEGDVLAEFAIALDELPTDARLTTWNGWGFDIDYYRRRLIEFGSASKAFEFHLTTDESKYGTPLTRGTFRGHDIGDVYYQTCWSIWARRKGLESTGLKAVAKAALNIQPHDIDAANILDYSDNQIVRYNLDDARWTWWLNQVRDLATA